MDPEGWHVVRSAHLPLRRPGGFPDDGLRRELIDGALIVSPSPAPRHQRVVLNVATALRTWCGGHGGEGCREFWFVDLDADRVEAYRLGTDGSDPPAIVERGSALISPLLDGLALDIDALLGPAEPLDGA